MMDSLGRKLYSKKKIKFVIWEILIGLPITLFMLVILTFNARKAKQSPERNGASLTAGIVLGFRYILDKMGARKDEVSVLLFRDHPLGANLWAFDLFCYIQRFICYTSSVNVDKYMVIYVK